MAKKPKKTENTSDDTNNNSGSKIPKGTFDINALKKDLGISNQIVKDKELTWIPFHKGFHDAVGLPSVPRGYVTQFRGFSDVGKSTGIYETIVGAQKLGDFIVIIDTEKSFNWEHARLIGFDYEDVVDSEGVVVNHAGPDFLYFDGGDLLDLFRNYDYSKSEMTTKSLRNIPVIEDVARLMNMLLDKQESGDIPKNMTFCWDSIGSTTCFQGATSNSNNSQWNAKALKNAFESILNFRIPVSRREKSKYINTFVAVQKIWLRPNAVGQPTIMHNGGEGFKYGVRLIFHLGGKTTSSAKKLDAVSGGKSYNFGVKTDIECVKNHVNGIELMGSVCSTPHGFINPDEKNAYVKENSAFINQKLGTKFEDFEVVEADLETDAYSK